MSTSFTVRFEMYGDVVLEAESAAAAERLAAYALIRWKGFGTDTEDVSVDGVSIFDDMTEERS